MMMIDVVNMSRVRLCNIWICIAVLSSHPSASVLWVRLVQDVSIRVTHQKLPLSSPGDQQIRKSPRQPTSSLQLIPYLISTTPGHSTARTTESSRLGNAQECLRRKAECGIGRGQAVYEGFERVDAVCQGWAVTYGESTASIFGFEIITVSGG
jgi:hypothetical protein